MLIILVEIMLGAMPGGAAGSRSAYRGINNRINPTRDQVKFVIPLRNVIARSCTLRDN